MTPLPPVLGTWMPLDSGLVPSENWSSAHPPAAWMTLLTSRRSTAERTSVLHDLGWAALQAGQDAEAARLFEEGLALCRSQRAARPQRARLLNGLSAADRVRGLYPQAMQRARAAYASGEDPCDRFHATLGLATALRLSGDRLLSTRHHFAALHLSGPLGHEADVNALLDLVMPGNGRPDAHLLHPDIQDRTVLQDTERLLESGVDFAGWAPRGSLFALRDEGRTLPRVQEALALQVGPPPELRAHVVTRGQGGVEAAGRFIPVHGQGRSLALLAYLIERGPSPWRVVADSVLDEGAESEQYVQIKYHLSRLRGLLGDDHALTLRRGRLALGQHWTWSTDLHAGGAPITLDAPLDWLNEDD